MNYNAKGYSGHKLYKVYTNMMERCYYKKDKSYPIYGGRGISVCSQWRKDRVGFIEWALKNGWKDGLEIDRIDVNGNYTPDNVRFVTRAVNAKNKRPRRLTCSQQRLIRRWSFLGMKQKEIAQIFNRDQSSISRVINERY